MAEKRAPGDEAGLARSGDGEECVTCAGAGVVVVESVGGA